MEKRNNIEVQSEDMGEAIKLIRIDGALDTVTSPKADELISALLDNSEVFIFDCTNLSYMNSAGLALMLKFHIHLQRRERQLRVVIINKLLRAWGRSPREEPLGSTVQSGAEGGS